MRLEEQRQGSGGDPLGIIHDEMLRCPARAPRGASGLLQGQEKFVAQKRLRGPCQRIPALRVDLRDAVEKSRRSKGHACAARNLTWVSASIRSRYLSASSAAMHPVPAEVTAWR